MIRYQNFEKATHKGMPVWKSPAFPRVSGFTDALLNKARVMVGRDDDKMLVHSGRVQIIQRMFNEYLEAWCAFLITELTPLQEEARKEILVINARSNDPGEKVTKLTTSGEIRAAKMAAQRRANRAQERKAALERLPVIYEQMLTKCKLADATVRQAEMNANQYLAKYSKATRFAVVEEEIPVMECGFSAGDIPDAKLMQEMADLIGEA